MTELQKRIAIAIIGIPLILAVLWFGGPWLIILFGLLAFFGSSEYSSMLANLKIKVPWHWMPLSLAVFTAMVFFPGWEMLILWLLFLAALIEAMLRWDPKNSLPLAALELFGAFYTAILPALCVRLGLEQQKLNLLLWLVVLIWLTDTVAYFVGSKWGRKRHIFAMSPNKSLEGFVAGALAPFILAIILYFAKVFDDLAVVLLTAFAAGIIGQFGDLVESMFKRFCNVKDSSNLIPGHGGILDRSDSILLAGSFLFCALEIMSKL